MEHTTFPVSVRAGTEVEAEAVTPPYHALQSLPDPRRKQGKRYSLAVILSLVIVAELAGGQTISGVIEWVLSSWSEARAVVWATLREPVMPDDLQ
jgi:preprotein translocase subunit SecE